LNTQTLQELQSKGPDDLDDAIDWFVEIARSARREGVVKWHPKQLETLLKQVATYAEEHLDIVDRSDTEDATMASIVAAHIQIRSEYERLVQSNDVVESEKDSGPTKSAYLLEYHERKDLTG